MTTRLSTLALALLAALPLACSEADFDTAAAPDDSQAAVEAHAPFSALTYEAALEKAAADDKLVVLDFTASWCPPCRAMEKSTWPDADVQAWIGREAVAIQVDVDKSPELSRTFRAANIPTIVFLDSTGKERGRFVGYRDPAEFLAEAAKHVR